MGRARGAKQFFNFNKGWNTEASPMTFPEGTAQDLDNVILDVDGSIRRRPGVDFESDPVGFGETLSLAQSTTVAYSFHTWKDVAGTESSSFFISQVGLNLYVHRQGGEDASQNLVGVLDMTPFSINTAEAVNSAVLVSNGAGALFVTGKYLEPFYVEWDGNTLNTTQIVPKIRDFEGSGDDIEVDRRPSGPGIENAITPAHIYDLFNQGWDISRTNIFALEREVPVIPDLPSEGLIGSLFDLIAEGIEDPFLVGEIGESVTWSGPVFELPSNADIVFLGMSVDQNSGNVLFKKSELKSQTFGNTPAPRGHFTIDLFDQDRQKVSGIQNWISKTTLNTRFTTSAFHNGRAFFSGLSDTGFTNKIYFSQQLTALDKVGNFHQEQDPTAEEFNDLLATDGGVITIPNAGKVLRLVEGPRGIIVFASNGVWQIAGKESAFDPTDSSVTRVSDIGCIGAETTVAADGTFFYWADTGIIGMQADQISGNLTAEVISKNTIQSGYLLIGGLQHKFARGVYIQAEKKVVWLYSTDSTFNGIDERHKYNGMLVLDTNIGAFYKYSLSDLASNTPFIVGIADQEPFVSTSIAEVVTVT